jgi:hypothetical protein
VDKRLHPVLAYDVVFAAGLLWVDGLRKTDVAFGVLVCTKHHRHKGNHKLILLLAVSNKMYLRKQRSKYTRLAWQALMHATTKFCIKGSKGWP